MRSFTVRDAEELYNVRNWGSGFFSIGENGNLRVHPRGEGDPASEPQGLDR